MNRSSNVKLTNTDCSPVDLTTAMPENDVMVESTHVNLLDSLINAKFEM